MRSGAQEHFETALKRAIYLEDTIGEMQQEKEGGISFFYVDMNFEKDTVRATGNLIYFTYETGIYIYIYI